MKFLFVERKGATAIWSVINPIASALLARGDQVVYCRMDDGNQRAPLKEPAGVVVNDVCVPTKRVFYDLYKQHRCFSVAFSKLLEETRPDLVHTHFCIPGISARLACHRNEVPLLVSTQHELFGSMGPHLRLGVRLTQRLVDGTTYVSKSVATSFKRPVVEFNNRSNLICSQPATAVIYNGVDLKKIEKICQTVPKREALKLVCCGRMVPVKGQKILIQALPEIHRSFSGIRLVFVGSGGQENELKQLVDKLGLTSSVDFLGWCQHERVIQEVATAGAAIMPNVGEEGFGLVVAEAMACGTPVIASHINVFKEVLGDEGECGWFFEKGNPSALSEVVCHFLNNPEEGQRRANNAIERLRKHFTVQRMVDSYLEFYDKLFNSLTK